MIMLLLSFLHTFSIAKSIAMSLSNRVAVEGQEPPRVVESCEVALRTNVMTTKDAMID